MGEGREESGKQEAGRGKVELKNKEPARMIRAGSSHSARRPGSGVRFSLTKASHAAAFKVVALLEKFNAFKTLKDVTFGSAGGGAALEAIVLGHGR